MHLICTIVDAAESSLQLLATCLIRKHSPVLHSLLDVNCSCLRPPLRDRNCLSCYSSFQSFDQRLHCTRTVRVSSQACMRRP